MSSSESDNEYEEVCRTCPRGSRSCALPFDPTSLENIILKISDKFDLRVIMSDKRVRSAAMVTAGLSFAGGLIGQHYGGKMGAAVGGAIGGACGLGIVAVSMRDAWQNIKSQLAEVFELVYDYLAGMGINDYKQAAKLLTSNTGASQQLAMVITHTASKLLKKKILSSLIPS